MRAARGRGDAVHVAADVLVGGLGPLECDLDRRAVLFHERERRIVNRLVTALDDHLLQVIDDALLVLEGLVGLVGFVDEADLHAAMQEARDLEPLADDRGIEIGARKDRGIGLEEDGSAAATRRAELLQAALRDAALELHLILGAAALHGDDDLRGERVDDRRTDAVQTA